MEIQKEVAVHIAESYAEKKDFSTIIGKLYDYMIKELKEIENIK